MAAPLAALTHSPALIYTVVQHGSTVCEEVAGQEEGRNSKGSRKTSSITPIRNMNWWRRPAWKQKTWALHNCHILHDASAAEHD